MKIFLNILIENSEFQLKGIINSLGGHYAGIVQRVFSWENYDETKVKVECPPKTVSCFL